MSLIRTANHAPFRGKDVAVRVARLQPGVRIKPFGDSVLQLTNSASAAKGATTITLDAALPTGNTIAAGQFIRFLDSATDKEYLAEVTADLIGDGTTTTGLTVKALDEEIPADAVGEWPAYVWDRTDSSVSTSHNLSGVTTYNSGDNRDGVITGSESSMPLPGIFNHYNDGAHTLEKAAQVGAECWVEKELPSPGPGFSKGATISGAALVTNRSKPSPGDGFIALDLEIAWVGAITETDPVPTA